MFDQKFFSRIESPINLAIFRIVFFGFIPFQINWNLELGVSKLPKEMRVPPVGLDWLVPYLPINSELTIVAGIFLILFCISGAIGFYSRTSSFFVAILSFYFFGIQFFFGDVTHYHNHIVWFSIILALSPCGDALSFDSRNQEFPAQSNRYSLPLRYIWLLYGVVYFFPGCWKIYESGLAWAFSDNLKYQMYQKWMQLDWRPLISLDQYPFIYKSGALITLVFEVGFLFFLFIPVLRRVFVIIGISFHLIVATFLKIHFWSFLLCYVAFFNWDRFFNKHTQLKEIKKNSTFCLTITSLTMIFLNAVFGFYGVKEGWPFASFPLFKQVSGPQLSLYSVEFVDENKKEVIDETRSISNFPLHEQGFKNLLIYITSHPDEMRKQEMLRGLAKSCSVCKSKYVQVYKVTHWVEPERLAENPVKKKLIYEVPL